MTELKGLPLSFNIYAHDEAEIEKARVAIVRFIAHHASQGRAVTAEKIAEALGNWDKNPIVRSHINNFFKS